MMWRKRIPVMCYSTNRWYRLRAWLLLYGVGIKQTLLQFQAFGQGNNKVKRTFLITASVRGPKPSIPMNNSLRSNRLSTTLAPLLTPDSHGSGSGACITASQMVYTSVSWVFLTFPRKMERMVVVARVTNAVSPLSLLPPDWSRVVCWRGNNFYATWPAVLSVSRYLF